jgi:hypothetical protein
MKAQLSSAIQLETKNSSIDILKSSLKSIREGYQKEAFAFLEHLIQSRLSSISQMQVNYLRSQEVWGFALTPFTIMQPSWLPRYNADHGRELLVDVTCWNPLYAPRINMSSVFPHHTAKLAHRDKPTKRDLDDQSSSCLSLVILLEDGLIAPTN